MGQQIFISDGSFTVPPDVTSLNICAVGGGGAGNHIDGTFGGSTFVASGGEAGQVVSTNVPVTPGEVIPITIGIGGTGSTTYITYANNGTQSLFGSYITAAGGVGGQPSSYYGNGGARSTCQGTYVDGTYQSVSGGKTVIAYGGQAGLGNGGSGSAVLGIDALNGTNGGGGGSFCASTSDPTSSGNGGNGKVVVNWDDPVPDGGLLLNGTLIPEISTEGGMHFYCKDLNGVDFDGLVQEVHINGTLTWKER